MLSSLFANEVQQSIVTLAALLAAVTVIGAFANSRIIKPLVMLYNKVNNLLEQLQDNTDGIKAVRDEIGAIKYEISTNDGGSMKDAQKRMELCQHQMFEQLETLRLAVEIDHQLLVQYIDNKESS